MSKIVIFILILSIFINAYLYLNTYNTDDKDASKNIINNKNIKKGVDLKNNIEHIDTEFSWNIQEFSKVKKEKLLKIISNFSDKEKIEFVIKNDIYFYLNWFYYRTLKWGLGSEYLWNILEDNRMKTFINCIVPMFSWKELIIVNERKKILYWYIKKYEKWDVNSLKLDYKKDNDFKEIIGVLIDMNDWLCNIKDKSCKYTDVKRLRTFIYNSMIKNWYWKDKDWEWSYEQQIDLYILCFLYKYDKNIENVMKYVNQFSYFRLLNLDNKIDLNKKDVLIEEFYDKLIIILQK